MNGIRRGLFRRPGRGRGGLRVVAGVGVAGGLALAGLTGPLDAAQAHAIPSATAAPSAVNAPPAPLAKVWEYTGGPQEWTVPDGYTRAQFVVYGAQGGGQSVFGIPIVGGFGGKAVGAVPVTAGEKLFIFVGGRGEDGGSSSTNPVPPLAIPGRLQRRRERRVPPQG